MLTTLPWSVFLIVILIENFDYNYKQVQNESQNLPRLWQSKALWYRF